MAAEPENEKVKAIANNFNKSFGVFKSDKEVVSMLSFKERFRNEGIVEGEARGRDKAALEMLELLKQGITPEEAMEIVRSKNTQQQAV